MNLIDFKDVNDHYDELLDICSKASRSNASSEELELECVNRCGNFLRSIYGEVNHINYDEIEIWCRRESSRASDVVMLFGNLYSYMLAKGVVIPYSEWVYEEKVTVGLKTYMWYPLQRFGGVSTSSAPNMTELEFDYINKFMEFAQSLLVSLPLVNKKSQAINDFSFKMNAFHSKHLVNGYVVDWRVDFEGKDFIFSIGLQTNSGQDIGRFKLTDR